VKFYDRHILPHVINCACATKPIRKQREKIIPLAYGDVVEIGIGSGHNLPYYDQDKVTRASLIIGIFKGLRLLFNGPLTYGWTKTANQGPGFNGQTPVQVMIAGGIPAMMSVRQHIDALRGGI